VDEAGAGELLAGGFCGEDVEAAAGSGIGAVTDALGSAGGCADLAASFASVAAAAEPDVVAGKSFGNWIFGWAGDGAGSFIVGSGGSSGIAGTAGVLSFAVPDVDAVAEAAGSAGFIGGVAGAAVLDGGVETVAVDGQAGALLSAASDAPFTFVSGPPGAD
jgi:hypothetical protein